MTTETAPRPELLALLARARADPEDEGPRLVLADWLEEYGDEHDQARAEFIRLECRRRTLPDPERQVSCRQLDDLWLEHATAWLGPLARLITVDHYPPHERGLLTVHAWGKRFSDEPLQALAGTEAWAWVACLRVHRLRVAGIDRVAGSPLLTTLAALDLSYNRMGDWSVERLSASPPLGALSRLDLQGNRFGPRGLEALAQARSLGPPFQALELDNNDLGPAGVGALTGTGLLPRLRDLGVARNRIGDAGAAALAGSPAAADLLHLRLRHNEITPAGVAALGGSPHLA